VPELQKNTFPRSSGQKQDVKEENAKMATPSTVIWMTGGSGYREDTKFSKVMKKNNGEWSLINYNGQKSENNYDKFILPLSLVLARPGEKMPFSLAGFVKSDGVNVVRPWSTEAPAKYQLLVEHIAVNDIPYKTVLDKLPEFTGSGCFKFSALKRLGFELDEGTGKNGNPSSGINTIKFVDLV
jgi:hypothetical protein